MELMILTLSACLGVNCAFNEIESNIRDNVCSTPCTPSNPSLWAFQEDIGRVVCVDIDTSGTVSRIDSLVVQEDEEDSRTRRMGQNIVWWWQ
ncbi:hypothetical protein EV421DRAFT_95686 [Armillaria borealis]|uniref:Secreted protein n=1 Tax=Armillaria borealis TaxID=47425 RepID=A0AA39KBA8_9AGAR|nr:hypothetical protein EV421DRAFT_95686 [Armillaria borealis]